MRQSDIPDFIATMFAKVEMGVDQVVEAKLAANNNEAMVSCDYPDMLEIQLDVEIEDDDLNVIDHVQCWVKIPWPTVHKELTP